MYKRQILILLLKPFSVDWVKEWLPDLVAVPIATVLEYWLEELVEASVARVLESCLVAVSYTHLDVYKRQGLGYNGQGMDRHLVQNCR